MLLALSLAGVGLLLGQLSTGSIAGLVSDPSGSPVPDAKVTAKSDLSGQEVVTQSSSAGIYAFASLPVGFYTVTVEKTGFKKLTRTPIEVRVAQRQPLDLVLEIGDVQQSIEVRGEQPVLQTQSPEVSQSFSQKFMTDLPLFFGGIRNPSAFVTFMPGVNQVGDQSINGSPRRGKESMIDGASHTIPESGGVVFDFPSAEMFGEFKLITNSFNAEYGRVGGGIELFVTKSGTNDIHGTAYYNLVRDIFNAAGWSINQNRNNPPGFRPKSRLNEIGGAAGGPVWIPKVYDGRNKSFFYFTYAVDQRPVTPAPNTTTAATARMKQGDFGEWSQLIYDPATTSGTGNAATRTPFPNNRIPTARFSRVSQVLLPLFPDPNAGSGVVNNYVYLGSSALDRYMWSIKGDHLITASHRVSGFLSYESNRTITDSFYPGPLGGGLDNYRKPKNVRFNYDWIVKPNLLLNANFGFTTLPTGWDNTSQGQKDWGSKLNIPGTARGVADSMPRIRFAGSGSLAATTGAGNSPLDGLPDIGVRDGKNVGSQINWTYHFTQGLTWIRGRHEYKIGTDIRRLRTFSNPLDLAFTNGTFNFERNQTALPSALATTGHSFASMLLGMVNTGEYLINAANPDDQARYGYQAFYVQDNWKVHPKLTLNVGVRYDVPLARYNPLGEFTSFDPDLPNPRAGGLPGALVYSGFGPGRTNRKRFGDIDWTEIGPRVGGAWQMNAKTVLRAGFGISYSPGNHTTGGFCLGCAFGFSAQVQRFSDGLNEAFNWDAGISPPPGFVPPPFIDPSFANGSSPWHLSPRSGIQPRQKNWSVALQREIGKGYAFEAAYVASRGTNMNSTLQLNQVNPRFLTLGTLLRENINSPAVVAAGYRAPYAGFNGTLAQALRPYPQFLDIPNHYGGQGRSWYDSLQVKFDKRFGNFQLYTNYTWSKTLSTLTRSQTAFQDEPQDSYNYRDEKSLMAFDVPHTINLMATVDMPFGKGKKWLSTTRYTDWIVGGWTISGLAQYASGTLIALSTPVGELGNGGLFTNFRKANLTGQDIRTSVARTDLDPNNPSTVWLNRAAFAIPGSYQFGTANRYQNDMRNPMRMTERMAIIKRTKLRLPAERTVDFEYRADCNNCFNRTNFGGIVGTLAAANFGRPTGVQNGGRLITMGLRMTF